VATASKRSSNVFMYCNYPADTCGPYRCPELAD
jgi:hypothetical protein